jgi:hypothetical protein
MIHSHRSVGGHLLADQEPWVKAYQEEARKKS